MRRLLSALLALVAAAPVATLVPGSSALLDADTVGRLSDAEVAPLAVEGTTSGTATGAMRYARYASFEPSLGVHGGAIYLSAFGFQSTGDALGNRNWVLVQKSTDGGLTWTDASPRVGPVAAPPQSNDPLVHVDMDTGRVFDVEMQGLQCAVVSFSDDGGATWITSPKGCGQSGGLYDHPTVWTAKPRTDVPVVGYPNVVYMCTNRIADTACATSRDGGLTFGPERPLVYQTSPLSSCIGGLTGHGAAAPDGTVYLGRNHCGRAAVAISRDDGLTWEVVKVSPVVPIGGSGNVIGHDVEVAVDEAGNAYALYTWSDGLAYVVVSTDGGVTWSAPSRVTPTGVNTAEFHTIAAGAAGRIAIGYYGTDTDGSSGSFSNAARWNAYITISTDMLSAAPTFTTVAVHPTSDPIAKGPCNDDTRCTSTTGSVGDFLDIVIDEAGRPWFAVIDVCRANCATGNTANNADLSGVGTLATGPALRGPAGSMLPPL